MKLNLDKFHTVNITVSFTGKKATPQDTYAVLNDISVAYTKAGEAYEREGCFALARDCKEKGNNIYQFLKEKGVYDKVFSENK